MEILNFSAVMKSWDLFVDGIVLTIVLTAVSCFLGTLFGIACAWCRVYGKSWLKLVVASYVEFFRNTPFLVQIFFIYFGIPSLGFTLNSITASLVALTLNLTAYACEIVRAGIEATPKGQTEAAESLALNRWQVFVHVVIPPALARIWTGLTSQLIIIMLATSLCSQISAVELSYVANFIAGRSFRTFESYIIATLGYLVLAIVLREFLQWLGPRFIFGKHVTGEAK